jgi:hypothetical protein
MKKKNSGSDLLLPHSYSADAIGDEGLLTACENVLISAKE